MTKFNATQLEDFVRDRAPQIAHDIRAAAEKAHNEADLVAEVEKLLDRFDRNPDFDIQLHLYRERTLLNGRADAVYNRLVIEYEPPHSLHKTNSARTNRHAIDQVKQYMDGLERLDRHKKERLAGVVLDGSYYIFIRHRDERWFEDDPLPVDAHSTQTFLRYLLSLSTELALTPENLERDFGENSNTARQVVPVFYNAIKETQNPKAKILFQQWQRQFQEVSGYDPTSGQLDTTEIGKQYAIKDKSPDLDRLFFAIHTYYATFIKLLALQVAYFYLMPKVGSGLASSADYPSDKLCGYLQEMERGGLFAQLGIRNFLEGDFFGWYLDIWDEGLDTAMRRLISDLANYSLVTLDIDPEETRDLLKQLYQNLMPKKLRHALGEYYTPDWLADRLLNQLGYEGDPRKRLLDPACGSGTFLVLAIKRIRKYAEDKMLPLASVLEQVLENIVGYDLNPLAVISARTNYLLALGDLLEGRKGEISIPIYLCDSILTPNQGRDLFSQLGFVFNTAVGRFSVPRSLIRAHYIDQFADLLEECVHSSITEEVFRARFLKIFPMDENENDQEVELAVDLFRKLMDLETKGINGIWARIIKNAFAPLFQGQFDYVAGNPPWVNWISLPSEYRQDIAQLWQKYNLFRHKGLAAKLGSACDDISVLMTYVATDIYLKENGKIAFVITQSVFKTKGGGEGFRSFRYSNVPLRVVHVDDMVDLQPFEGATNRTSVFVIEKNKSTKYPVAYTLWKKKIHGGIKSDWTIDEVINQTVRHNQVAEPIDNGNILSPWISGPLKALTGTKKAIGPSNYRARKGIETSMAGIYRLNIVTKRPDGVLIVSNDYQAGKEIVENVNVSIEPTFIFPYLRGRDVSKWGWQINGHIIVPQNPKQPNKGYYKKDLEIEFPKTYNYLNHFHDQLAKRAVYKKLLEPNGEPFYAMYNVGKYTFADYKVVWKYIASHLTCAVITSYTDNDLGNKIIVPDSKLVLIPFEKKDEAHYVCSMLNNSIAKYIVDCYAVETQLSTHVTEFVKIPDFDPHDIIHKRLAQISQEAHKAKSQQNEKAVEELEKELDLAAARIWGLSDDELQEILYSLNEL